MPRLVSAIVASAVAATATAEYVSEYKIMPGHTMFEDYSSPLPHTYLEVSDLPDDFNWGDVNGTNYLTKRYCFMCGILRCVVALTDVSLLQSVC